MSWLRDTSSDRPHYIQLNTEMRVCFFVLMCQRARHAHCFTGSLDAGLYRRRYKKRSLLVAIVARRVWAEWQKNWPGATRESSSAVCSRIAQRFILLMLRQSLPIARQGAMNLLCLTQKPRGRVSRH